MVVPFYQPCRYSFLSSSLIWNLVVGQSGVNILRNFRGKTNLKWQKKSLGHIFPSSPVEMIPSAEHWKACRALIGSSIVPSPSFTPSLLHYSFSSHPTVFFTFLSSSFLLLHYSFYLLLPLSKCLLFFFWISSLPGALVEGETATASCWTNSCSQQVCVLLVCASSQAPAIVFVHDTTQLSFCQGFTFKLDVYWS